MPETDKSEYEEVAILDAAERGDVEAQLRYGKILCGLDDRMVAGFGMEKGIHVVRYWDGTDDGMIWLKKAAESGSVEAANILRGINSGDIHLISEPEYYYNEAMRCIYGENERNLEKGEELLSSAADEGWSPAQRELAKLCMGLIDPRFKSIYRYDFKKLLENASQKGDAEAQYRLAVLECEEVWQEYPFNDPEYAAGLRWVHDDADRSKPV